MSTAPAHNAVLGSHAGAAITLSVEASGHTIPVKVIRKRVKNLNLRVHADGSVTMSIPLRTRIEVAGDFLRRRGPWIAERLERVEQRAAEASAAEIASVDGKIPLWGRLVDAGQALATTALATFGSADTTIDLENLDPDELQRRIDVLYRQELSRELPDIADKLESRIGVSASAWRLRAMKTRWGSCTPRTRVIRINTNLAAYPRICLETVVAHELTHVLEPSHNARFHALLDRFEPNNRIAMELLKRAPREAAKMVADSKGHSK